MNAEYLKKMMWCAQYHLKPNTSNSYVHSDFAEFVGIVGRKEKESCTIQRIEWLSVSGIDVLLPITLCFRNIDEATIKKTGRGRRSRVKQMSGQFTKPEKSPYKLFKPYKVNTAVWQVDGYKTLYFGSLGIILAEGGHPKDNGDLMIFHTADWVTIDVFIFKGLYKPNEEATLPEVAEFVSNLIVK